MGFFSKIEDWGSSAVNWVENKSEDAYNSAKDEYNSVKDSTVNVFDKIETAVVNVGKGVENEITKDINKVSGVVDEFSGYVQSGFQSIVSAEEKTMNFFESSFDTVKDVSYKVEHGFEVLAKDTYKIGSSLFGLFENVAIPMIEFMADHPQLVIGATATYAGAVYYNQIRATLR